MIGRGPALRHHPLAEVHSFYSTLGNYSLVAVAAEFLTIHRTTTDHFSQGARRVPSAPPVLPVSTAKLPAFGCVDAMKAYSLACDFNGVAVYHAGRAGDVGKGEARQQGKSKGGGK